MRRGGSKSTGDGVRNNGSQSLPYVGRKSTYTKGKASLGKDWCLVKARVVWQGRRERHRVS